MGSINGMKLSYQNTSVWVGGADPGFDSTVGQSLGNMIYGTLQTV